MDLPRTARAVRPLLVLALALAAAGCSSGGSDEAVPGLSAVPSTVDAPAAASPSGEAAPAAPGGVSLPDGGATGRYRGYRNDRYGFLVEVPRDLVEQEAPENGDGATFRSPDGRATLLAYGSNDLDEQTPRQTLAAEEQDLRDDGVTVTYARLVGSVATASGTKGADVVFVRTVDAGSTLQTLRWTYPAAEKARYDAAVQHSASTFRPGAA